MRGFLLLAILTAARAGCSADKLDPCEIPAGRCTEWPLSCDSLDSISVDISAANGNVQVFLVSGLGAACTGPSLSGFCGYPSATYRCTETRAVSYLGSCTLIVENTNLLESVWLSGSLKFHAHPEDSGPALTLGWLIVMAIVATVLGLFGAVVVCVCYNSLRCCGVVRPSAASYRPPDIGLELLPQNPPRSDQV